MSAPRWTQAVAFPAIPQGGLMQDDPRIAGLTRLINGALHPAPDWDARPWRWSWARYGERFASYRASVPYVIPKPRGRDAQ